MVINYFKAVGIIFLANISSHMNIAALFYFANRIINSVN